MTIHHIKLIERITTEGHADFHVAADTPEDAAAVVSEAYQAAQKEGIALVKLPSGETSLIDKDEKIEQTVEYTLLDREGADIQTIIPNSTIRTPR